MSKSKENNLKKKARVVRSTLQKNGGFEDGRRIRMASYTLKEKSLVATDRGRVKIMEAEP